MWSWWGDIARRAATWCDAWCCICDNRRCVLVHLCHLPLEVVMNACMDRYMNYTWIDGCRHTGRKMLGLRLVYYWVLINGHFAASPWLLLSGYNQEDSLMLSAQLRRSVHFAATRQRKCKRYCCMLMYIFFFCILCDLLDAKGRCTKVWRGAILDTVAWAHE